MWEGPDKDYDIRVCALRTNRNVNPIITIPPKIFWNEGADTVTGSRDMEDPFDKPLRMEP